MDFVVQDNKPHFDYQPNKLFKQSKDRKNNYAKMEKTKNEINNQIRERGRGIIVRDISSYEKSIEMPSSYLEPSVYFDEREGTGNPNNALNVGNYKFNPHFGKGSRPMLLVSKLPNCVPILPKRVDLDSPNAISMSEEFSMPSREASNQRNDKQGLSKQSSEYFELNAAKHEEDKHKPSLKDY